ncbi:MAG: hypothetical protein Q9219_001821 [cf. Caloplaca sp. 3 TL-2023]
MSIEYTDPWDPNECRRYLVDVVGNQERFPERNPYPAGATAILERLKYRYGEDYFKSSSRVLRNYLENPDEGTLEEQTIWRGWRNGQAQRVRAVPDNMPSYYENLDPVKFSPYGDSDADATMTPTNFDVESDLDPFFHRERSTRLTDFFRDYDETSARIFFSSGPSHQQTKYGDRPKGMRQSFTDNNLSFRRGHSPQASPSISYHSTESEESQHASVKPLFAQERGRIPASKASPAKSLEGIPEDHESGDRYSYSPQKQLPEIPDLPASPTKRSRSPMKQLFGDRGYLGRSTSMKELPSEEYRRKGMKHLGERLKQRVGGVTGSVSKLIPSSISHGEISKFIPSALSNLGSPSKSGGGVETSTFPVSVEPPEQAHFYAQAELMICSTANAYLKDQHEAGRMSLESLTNITNGWAQKNRPQVLEFMFDQLTQRDLILHNLKTFRFYGPCAENGVMMNSTMNSWKTLAKEMNVRTFCMGDVTIKRHIQDVYMVLELLGAHRATFLAFQTEQIKVMAIMRRKEELRKEAQKVKFGVERAWMPPGGWPQDSTTSEAYVNPFFDDWKSRES